MGTVESKPVVQADLPYPHGHLYQTFRDYTDETGQEIPIPSTLTAESKCMIIGSYGDQYSPQIQARVAKKRVSGGEFLEGVSDDIEIVQAMVNKDPNKSLGLVLPDVPGAQRNRAHYISKIKEFLRNCPTPGALIWYSGHGETGTGNWAFRDGFISLEDIIKLYQQHFSGRLLTIVSNCCYAGHWVHRLAEKMNYNQIGACGHQAANARMALKIYTSCQHDEASLDGIYAKQGVRAVPELNYSMVFQQKILKDESFSHFQIPMSIDTTHVTCFHPGKYCSFNMLSKRALWSWKDMMTGDDRKDRLTRRFCKSWEWWPGRQVWSIVLLDDDKLETLEKLAKDYPSFTTADYSGYILYHGRPLTQAALNIVTNYGPV